MAGTSLDITRRKRTEMEQQFLAEVGPLLAQEPGRRRYALRAGRHGRQTPGRLLRDRPGRGQRRDSTGERLLFAREEAGARRGVRAPAARKSACADPPAGSQGRDKAAVRDRRVGGPGGVGPERGAPPAAAGDRGPLAPVGAPPGTGPDPGWLLPRFGHARPAIRCRTICGSRRSSPAAPRSPSTTHACTARPNEPSPPATRCSPSSLTICAIRWGPS